MKRIYKYTFKGVGHQPLVMPGHGQFLAFQTQDGNLCAWFLVEPSLPNQHRPCYLYATGEDYPVADLAHLHYRGTAQLNTGVWHLFA